MTKMPYAEAAIVLAGPVALLKAQATQTFEYWYDLTRVKLE
jgi:hypothetical protein